MRQDRPLFRCAAWIALLAFWLQIGLSLGHAHALGLGAPGEQVLSAPSDGTVPQRDGPVEQACAICVSMHLAGISVLPTPPAVALPADRRCLLDPGDGQLAVRLAFHRGGNPRAPPAPL
jgi:hypothetical protein